MDILIRKATLSDYDSLCELFDAGDALHREHLPRIFRQPLGAPRTRDHILALIADENVALLVAESAGRLLGYVHAMVREAPDFPVMVPRRYVVVDEVVVRSNVRNQGIGSRLMDEAQAWAMTKGATSVELNVYEFNQTAIAFYEGLGYHTLSRKMSKEV